MNDGRDLGVGARLCRLAEHLEPLERPGFEFGQWVEPTIGQDGVVQIGWYSTSPGADAFVRDAYELGWVVDFDWPEWVRTPEAVALLSDPMAVSHATVDDLAKLLTVFIRQDRFAEGELAAAFESGFLTATLRRAQELADEASGTVGAWADRPWGIPWASDNDVIDAAAAITEVGLRRSMCYGPCLVYTLILRRSGTARFIGEHFVDVLGPHRARIDPAAFGDISLAVSYLRFEALPTKYAVDYTDAATSTTWIVRGGRRKEVEDYGGAGPRRLRLIESLIDGAAAELDWTAVTTKPASPDGLPLFVGIDADESWRPPARRGEVRHWTQAGRSVGESRRSRRPPKAR